MTLGAHPALQQECLLGCPLPHVSCFPGRQCQTCSSRHLLQSALLMHEHIQTATLDPSISWQPAIWVSLCLKHANFCPLFCQEKHATHCLRLQAVRTNPSVRNMPGKAYQPLPNGGNEMVRFGSFSLAPENLKFRRWGFSASRSRLLSTMNAAPF